MKSMWAVVAAAFLTLTGSLQGQINVPSTVDVHKPIVVSAANEADVYIWHVPAPAIHLTVDGGKTLHIWAPVGKYDLRLTTIKVAWEDKKVSYDEHFAQFQVLGDKPNPDPDPMPTAFKEQVANALKTVSAPATSYKKNVANNYRAVASEAKANPNAWDAATMVNEVKTRNATALPSSVLAGWSGFWPKLARAFTELKLDSNDLNGHIKAFEDVADVLSK